MGRGVVDGDHQIERRDQGREAIDVVAPLDLLLLDDELGTGLHRPRSVVKELLSLLNVNPVPSTAFWLGLVRRPTSSDQLQAREAS